MAALGNRLDWITASQMGSKRAINGASLTLGGERIDFPSLGCRIFGSHDLPPSKAGCG
jgi:hypothetical protein